jgi:hypothetical protein
MITLKEYFQGRDDLYPDELTDELRRNAGVTVDRINGLLNIFGENRNLTSGWRPAVVNAKTPGAAKFSKHTTCEAGDVEDHDGTFDEWCFDNPKMLEQIGLWQEHPASTKGWTHLQIVSPKSGKRVFYP